MIIPVLIATFAVSLISFVGILISHAKIKKFLHYFISFAAGSLVAVSFFDLIPHAVESMEGASIELLMAFVVAGIVLFFTIERFIHWHHCDKDDCHERPAGMLVLTGDFVHNFLDGLLIAGAFMLNMTTGILTTITVAIHEIPQEFGDYAVLLHSGYKKKKALMLNFLSALSAVIGGVLGVYLFNVFEKISAYAVLITAGGFLYIALTDIVPSMHKHNHKRSMIFIELVIFLCTIVGMYFLVQATHG